MEKISRRKFLKLGTLCAAGVSAAAIGASSVASAATTATTGTYQKNGKRLQGTAMGMVIDMREIDSEKIAELQKVCHAFHNVPNVPNEKDEVKWIWAEKYVNLFAGETTERLAEKFADKDFVALCNHCESPVCVRVCPTKATFTNDQGIVLMDMHRCIGCRNCMAACPYGARSFNFVNPRDYLDEVNYAYPTRMKGVVEKCNFCAERVAIGQLPLCVEAAGGAISFGDLNDPESKVSKLIAENFTLQRKLNLGTKPKVYYII